MLHGLTKKTCILVSSTLAAGIVQDSLLEKLEKASAGGEVETTGGYFCHQDRKFFPLGHIKLMIRFSSYQLPVLDAGGRYLLFIIYYGRWLT